MGWNLKEAALACGLAPSSWRGWEQNGRPHNYVEVCKSIAERSGCNYDWLVDGRSGGGPGSSLPLLDSNQKPSGWRLPDNRRRLRGKPFEREREFAAA